MKNQVYVILDPSTGCYWGGEGWVRESREIKMYGTETDARFAIANRKLLGKLNIVKASVELSYATGRVDCVVPPTNN